MTSWVVTVSSIPVLHWTQNEPENDGEEQIATIVQHKLADNIFCLLPAQSGKNKI